MRQKRILIYRPNDKMRTEENGTSNYNEAPSLPYSLLVVASILRENNYFVNFYDASINPKESFGGVFLKYEPDILIVQTSVVACDLSLGKIKEAKGFHKEIKIISLINQDFQEEIIKRFNFLDFVVRREWAKTTLDIVNFIHNKTNIREINGIYYRDYDKKIIKTGEGECISINSRPLPAFDLVSANDYETYSMEISVGCPHHCFFCFFGRYPYSGWEGKEIDHIILEIKEMFRSGIKPIFFMDHEITADKDWCKKLLKRIINENLIIRGDANIRASSIDEEMIILLKKAGFDKLGMGVESGNQFILDENKKELSIDQVKKAFILIKKHNLTVKTFFMIGLFGDTRETIKETYNFIKKELKAYNASFDIVIPFPDTPYYKMMKNNKWIEDITIDNLIWIYKNMYNYPNLKNFEGVRPVWYTGTLSFDELLELFNKYYYKINKSPTRNLVVMHLKDRTLFQKMIILFFRNPRIFINLVVDFFIPKNKN